jgi:integrase
VRIKYLKVDPNRHGKPRLYVRLPGQPLVRLSVDSVDHPDFSLAYAAALNGELQSPAKSTKPAKPGKTTPGTVGDLTARYVDFLMKDPVLSAGTKLTRRRHLEEVCRETSSSGIPASDFPLEHFTGHSVQVLLDRKRATPGASNNRRKALLAMFRWAVKRGHAETNPVLSTDRIKTGSEGFTPWAVDHIERFIETHPIGTKPYLALALLLYTGQRRGDVVTFGRQHVQDGALVFTQQKNEKRMHKKMRIPILPALQEALDLVPPTQLTFLQTEYGKPFTVAGFGGWFRDKCDQAGLQGLSAHGLRKALLTIGANMNLTDRELMAVAGHESAKDTTRYTRKRDRDLLAASGMAKLSGVRFGKKIVAPKTEVTEK